jgi:hypothetical protein
VADGYETGDEVVIVRGLLAGIEATVLRPARLGFYLIRLAPDAPRWAAIRRARAADWALAPADGPSGSVEPAAVLVGRRRIAFADLAAVLLVPFLLRAWDVVPALAVALGAGIVTGLVALHATYGSRPWRRR